MEQVVNYRNAWKGTKSAEEAKELIDYGVMLKWSEMRTLKRTLSEKEQNEIVRHFARRLVERVGQRLQAEIITESMLIWLANVNNEDLLNAFLEELFAQPNCEDACWILVEVALTVEVTENTHEEDIFAMAVTLICELGINIRAYEEQFPGEFRNAVAVLDHVATYLLSVSNTNNSIIRLCLLHYFGAYEHGRAGKNYLNRIMNRFGHTVLEHLFTLLFRKRSEAIALQYLLENLPYILEGDMAAQKIVHETFKYYMLKQPERFALFIQAFAEHLQCIEEDSYTTSKKVYMQHLGALLKVASEVNHRHLGREFMIAINRFENEPFCEQLIQQIMIEPEIRKSFKALLQQLRDGEKTEDVIETVAQFRSSKRGRKPSFSKAERMGTMHQVTYLGQIEIPKAS